MNSVPTQNAGDPEQFQGKQSRRNWFANGILTLPVIATALSNEARAAETTPGSSKIDGGELAAGTKVYNVRAFGAKGDGQELDTKAIQAAIDACAGDRGGIVLVPAGDFLTGTLQLKSHVTLHLASAGRLLGSGAPDHFSAGKGIPPGNGNIVLLYAADAENVTIEGRGTVDGQGAKFYTGRGDNTGPGQNSSNGYFQRPHLLIFHRCRNVVVRDVFLTASAYHCMRVLECRNVRLEDIRIHNRANKNNDGFHLVGCQFVHIANCDVACQDDACALFGSNKFVTVTNCTFSTRWSIFRFAGGEAENITISNCVIYDTYGCAIKMRFGANSRIENVAFSNLIMRNVTGPISIGLDSSRQRPGQGDNSRAKGVVRNLSFSNIRATVVAEGRQHEDLPFPSSYRPGETRTCIVLNGVGEDFLENITFENVHISFEGGGTAEEAAHEEVPKMAGEYFELGVLPAYALFARNVRALTLNNVRFEVGKPDLRPAVVCEQVQDANFQAVSAQGNPEAKSVLRFVNTSDVLLSGCRVLRSAGVFLRVEGAASKGIMLDGGDLSRASEAVATGQDVAKAAVKVRG